MIYSGDIFPIAMVKFDLSTKLNQIKAKIMVETHTFEPVIYSI